LIHWLFNDAASTAEVHSVERIIHKYQL